METILKHKENVQQKPPRPCNSSALLKKAARRALFMVGVFPGALMDPIKVNHIGPPTQTDPIIFQISRLPEWNHSTPTAWCLWLFLWLVQQQTPYREAPQYKDLHMDGDFGNEIFTSP